MHVIKARSGQFRRSDVLFTAAAWILIANATPAQLAEPMLHAVEVRASDIRDGQFQGVPVSNPEEPLNMAAAEEAAAAAPAKTAKTQKEPPKEAPTGRTAELVAMKMDDLRPIAEPLGIEIKPGMKKDDVVAAIVAAEEAAAAAPN